MILVIKLLYVKFTMIYDDYDQKLKNDLINLSIERISLMEDRKFDISYTVEKQYRKFSKWIDLVTVMGNVNCDVISKLSGVVLIGNMSNNEYDYINNVKLIMDKYPERLVGIVTQYRIQGLINMTPGIHKDKSIDYDQKYRNPTDVDTDIFIVGRAIYNSDNYIQSVEMYKYFNILFLFIKYYYHICKAFCYISFF